MCIFTADIVSVSSTRIFARRDSATQQVLCYSMHLSAAGSLAMVLPLPVPPGSPESAIRWIDLSGYPRLFDDLDSAFDEPMVSGNAFALGAQADHILAVTQVGDFDASFVPTVADFARLDRRFRLPDQVMANAPHYADWGFAVFKLRAEPAGWWARLRGRAGAPSRDYHPMAFSFPTRDPVRAFFPTVHVHDGKHHDEAIFDHSLYVQRSDDAGELGAGWQANTRDVAATIDFPRAEGIVTRSPCYRMQIVGMRANEDIWA